MGERNVPARLSRLKDAQALQYQGLGVIRQLCIRGLKDAPIYVTFNAAWISPTLLFHGGLMHRDLVEMELY